MARAGYCSECGTNVWLDADGSCVSGHPASCVSDAYEVVQPWPVPVAPPKKNRSGLIIGIAVALFAGLALCGIVSVIAVPVFFSASSTAAEKSCFANQRVAFGAIRVYLAENPSATAPSDWRQAMSEIVPGIIKSEPKCPSGGTYTLMSAGDQTIVGCSIHGSFTAESAP
jgi:hypothetical protein